MTGVLSRRSRLVTVSATAVAFGASLAFGGATAVFAEEPQPIIDVVYVATNVDTSQFDTGTIAVTYSPSYDATHPVPDLSLYGGVGEPQPMTINYTVAPQAPAAGTTSVVTAPVSGWPVVKTSTSAGTTGGIVGATASYLSFSAVAGAGSTSNIPAAQASWTTHWADVLSGKYQPTSTIEVKRQSSPLLPAGFGAMTQPVYAMSTSASNGVSGPAGANIPVFATASGMDGVVRATYTTPFPIVSDTDSHTVDILRGAGDGDLSKTQTVNLNMSFAAFVLTTTDGTTPVDPDVKPAITSKAPANGQVGAAYTHQLTSTGSPAATYRVSAGKLPDGLTLDGVTGKITGKPTKSASFSFTVEAKNTAGVATANYTLKVTAAGTTPSCTVPRKVPVFTDVAVKQKFYAEIDWMHCMKLSTGYADKTYRPKTELSREAMAAFMYRLEAPKSYKAPAKSPFSDVPTTHKFYKEIAWMKESKLSTGYADGTYRPKENLSREAMAAFIYRLEASDTKSYQAPAKAVFADVAMGQKFSKEIAWMKESKLSTGYADGTYRPKENLSREAMAAFIYRLETAYRS